MKKFLLVIFVLLLASTVTFSQDQVTNGAQAPSQPIDYSAYDSAKLADTLSTNPNIGTQLTDADFARALEQNPNLLSNPSILQQANTRIQANPAVLNDNPNAKKQWFAVNKITDNGAQIKSFDGKQLITAGEKSTTFNLKDFPGASVFPDGHLALADKNEFANANIVKSADGSVTVTGGTTALHSNEKVDYTIIGSRVTVDEAASAGEVHAPTITGLTIHSDNPIKITDNVNGLEGLTISGDKVTMIENNQQPQIVFTGTVGFSRPEVSFETPREYASANTEVDFVYNSKTITFKSPQATNFYTEKGMCDGTRASCVGVTENSLDVYATENHLISTTSDKPLNVNVFQISDDSKVYFKENNAVTVQFSKDFPKIRGDVSALESTVTTQLQTGRVVHDIKIENHELTICSDCLMAGRLTNELLNAVGKAYIAVQSKNIQGDKFISEIQKTTGVRPSWWLGDLDSTKNAKTISSIISEAKKQGLSPELVSAAAFQENLDTLLTHISLYPDSTVNGRSYLQMDTFGDEVQTLKEQGYLPADFNEGDQYTLQKNQLNEQNQPITPATFKNTDVALEAFAATLALRRDTFLRDAKSQGIDTSTLTQDQLNYWTYAYYNAPGSARSRLTRNGADIPTTTISDSDRASPKVAEVNARVVYSTAKLFDAEGVFSTD